MLGSIRTEIRHQDTLKGLCHLVEGRENHYPGVQLLDAQRNMYVGNVPGNSVYAQAIIKGPGLEIPLFGGDDALSWLKQCEKFFEISGTPGDQWVNLATTHFQGRAATWLRNMGIPWQILTWPQLCSMISHRFSVASAQGVVEQLQNIKQYRSTILNYIDRFEECVELVKRDHPYLHESFFMSCFIGG